MLARLVLLLTPAILLAIQNPARAQSQENQPPPAAVDPLKSLDSAQIQELFQWLQRHAVQPDALSQDELNRAALRSLLQDSRTGAAIIPNTNPGPATSAATPAPALFAPLGKSAAYFRPGALEPDALKPAAAFLTALPPETDTLILDLRAPLTNAPLAGAAALASLFLPENTPLFLIKTSSAATPALTTTGPRAWNRQLWLLIDDQSPPALDLAAHCLVRHAGALTFGSPTSGRLTDFTLRPLGPGHTLQLPSATVSWPDGTRLTGTSLAPQFPIKPAPNSRQALLSLTDPAALLSHLQETDRPRPNEAALMTGLPPELLPDPPASAPTPPRSDPVLQQATDLVESTRFLKLKP